MQPTVSFPNCQDPSQQSTTGLIGDLKGFKIYDPYLLPGYNSRRTKEELDNKSLTKLWETGFSVDSLDEAFRLYKIAPLRAVSQVWKILGYSANPGGETYSRYTDKCLTSLAIGYPDPNTPGDVYAPDYFIRVRYPEPLHRMYRDKKTGKDVNEYRRYDQPVKSEKSGTHSEPYFLCNPAVLKRLMDPTIPLIITEGELKAASLNLLGLAAIGFGGATMWSAPAKSGKHRLHPCLDPKGIRARWAFPIIGRPIFLVPDMDYRTNQMVRRSFLQLAAALYTAGANTPRMIDIPDCPTPDAWKGIDDYIRFYCGNRWSGSESSLSQAVEVWETLVRDHSFVVRMNDVRYPATSVTRGADRFHAKYQSETRQIVKLITDTEGGSPVGWLMYDKHHYSLLNVYQLPGGTNGKFVTRDQCIRVAARETHEEGIDIAMAEGDTDKPKEMEADYPNRLMAIVDLQLPSYANDSLIEPFASVRVADKMTRLRDGLVNLTRLFETPLEDAWERRGDWYLPPNYRWVSTGTLNTSFSGLVAKPQCPLFMELLHNAFNGDADRVRTLQLFFGKIVCNPMFTGTQQFLALYGQPGSGKGTLTRIITRLIGSGGIAAMDAQGRGAFDTGVLPGKKLILFHESPDSAYTGNFSVAMSKIIRSITGEDQISCEGKFRDPLTMYIKAEIVIIGETPPSLPMHKDAFRRRAVFVNLTHPIKNRDYRVEAKILNEELPGILWWALEGAHALNDGAEIATPLAGQEDLDDVSMSVSPIDRFIEECVIQNPAGTITFSDLRTRFEEWCVEHHFHRSIGGSSGKRLSYAIRDFFKIQSKNVRGPDGKPAKTYVGVSLVQTEAY